MKHVREGPKSLTRWMEANMRFLVCRPENIRMHVTGNILKLEAPRSSFAKMSVSMVNKGNKMNLSSVTDYVISVS